MELRTDAPVVDAAVPVGNSDGVPVSYRCLRCQHVERTTWHDNKRRGPTSEALIIRPCSRCKGRSFEFGEGTYGLLTDQPDDAASLAARAALGIVDSPLWVAALSMLRQSRVLMADGHRATGMCQMCVDKVHNPKRPPCECACHLLEATLDAYRSHA